MTHRFLSMDNCPRHRHLKAKDRAIPALIDGSIACAKSAAIFTIIGMDRGYVIHCPNSTLIGQKIKMYLNIAKLPCQRQPFAIQPCKVLTSLLPRDHLIWTVDLCGVLIAYT